MKKGAVPIPYIIALLLGIAVVAILGYWFFVLGGQWGGEVSLQGCRNKALLYCQAYQGSGYDEDEDGQPSPLGWFGRVAPEGEQIKVYASKCAGYRTDLGFSSGWDPDIEETTCKTKILVTT